MGDPPATAGGTDWLPSFRHPGLPPIWIEEILKAKEHIPNNYPAELLIVFSCARLRKLRKPGLIEKEIFAMARSKHRRKPNPGYAPKKLSYLKKLDIAVDLLEDGEIEEARQVLEDLHRHHPARTDVLQNLAYACNQLGDTSSYLNYCIKLCRLTPNDPYAVLALATAYALDGRPVLALRTYRYFVDNWSQHGKTEEIRKLVASMEPEVEEMIVTGGLTGDDRVESAEMHEELQILLNQNRYEEGSALAALLIERHPHFAPAYNNLSLLQFLNKHSAKAIATARQVLSFDPDNFQAMANLIRFLFLSGERDQARLLVNNLKAMQSENPDIWIKKMETFSFLCDDEAVLEAFEGAEKAKSANPNFKSPLCYHLAAAAAWFTGKEELAKRYWKQALAIAPGFDLAAENLLDLSYPVGERHGAWAYSMSYWLPKEAMEGLIEAFKTPGKNDKMQARLVCQFLEDHPEIIQVIPILLERSDAKAVEFVIALTGLSSNPELLEAVKQFALGQRGSDQLRMRAAQLACEKDLLPAGEIRMWMQGEWTDSLLIAMEITGEPVKSKLSGQAQKLFIKALYCLHDNNGVEAETLLNQVRNVAPNEPAVLNNLAMAYKLQKRQEEYRQLAQQIHEQYPDYFFGCINMAEIYLERGETEKARNLLMPLLQRKKVHVSEMAALCALEIELELKAGRRNMARTWFDLCEKVYPDHPNLEILRARIYKPNLQQLLNFPIGAT
jgi:tetratricopeptide (TPR) repeat protein